MKISAFLFTVLRVAAFTVAGVLAAHAQGNSASVGYRTQQAWSGAYLGLQLGGHFTDTQVATTEQSAVDTDLSRNGAFGGIQFGDGRLLHRLYVGGEADSAFGRFVSGHSVATGGGNVTSTFEAHRRFIGTVRVKVGRPFGRLLVYGTGGFALGGLEQGVTFNGPAPTSTAQVNTSAGGVEPGYAVGGGAAYRMDRRLSYQVESLYYRLQDETLRVAAVPGSGGAGYDSTLRNMGGLLRVGVNYHF